MRLGLYSSFYGVYIYNYFFELPTGMCFLSARRLHQPSEQVKIAPRPPKKKKNKNKSEHVCIKGRGINQTAIQRASASIPYRTYIYTYIAGVAQYHLQTSKTQARSLIGELQIHLCSSTGRTRRAASYQSITNNGAASKSEHDAV